MEGKRETLFSNTTQTRPQHPEPHRLNIVSHVVHINLPGLGAVLHQIQFGATQTYTAVLLVLLDFLYPELGTLSTNREKSLAIEKNAHSLSLAVNAFFLFF